MEGMISCHCRSALYSVGLPVARGQRSGRVPRIPWKVAERGDRMTGRTLVLVALAAALGAEASSAQPSAPVPLLVVEGSETTYPCCLEPGGQATFAISLFVLPAADVGQTATYLGPVAGPPPGSVITRGPATPALYEQLRAGLAAARVGLLSDCRATAQLLADTTSFDWQVTWFGHELRRNSFRVSSTDP